MKIDDVDISEDKVVVVGDPNLVIRGRRGLFALNRYSPIGRSMMWYGEHGENELNFCAQFIEKGSLVIDIGAHQGTHTKAFSEMVGPAGFVYSFEPQRLMYLNMCATLALNSIENVCAVNLAIGDISGSVRIAEFDYHRRGHFSGMRISSENTGELIDLLPLDQWLESKERRDVGFLKVDVEGMEIKVLQGCLNAIKTHQPIIYHEFHADDTEHGSALRDFHRMNGYEVFRHAPYGFNPNNFFAHEDDRFKGGQDHNVLAIPRSKSERYASQTAGLQRLS